MAMTVVEKIIARHAKVEAVKPGDIVSVDVDVVMANDITTSLAVRAFRATGVDKVFDPSRVCLVPSHLSPSMDIASAILSKDQREFAREQGCVYYEHGRAGIEHVLLPEEGHILPGELYVGADSHTCTVGAIGAFTTGMGSTDIGVAMATGTTWLKVPPTIRIECTGTFSDWVTAKDLILEVVNRIGLDGARYKAIQFAGPAIDAMSMDARFTLTNMAIECGAKAGIIEADDVTDRWLVGRAKRSYTAVHGDPDATFERIVEIDCSTLDPRVAMPFAPANGRRLDDVLAEGELPIDQVFIGSCTNGRLEDLRLAAAVMADRPVHPRVRCIVVPASQAVYRQALAEGIVTTLTNSGCAVEAASCGPCAGGAMGVLAEGERCVSTSNRNFPGRMGHRDAEIYLVSPAVAAASAVAGRLAHPREVLAQSLSLATDLVGQGAKA